MKIKIIELVILLITLVRLSETKRKHNPSHEPHKPKGVTCDQVPCPQDRGMCNLDNECVCFRGYVTFLPDTPVTTEMTQCNYEQSSQMTAFLLEFIISFGAGHFYIGRYLMGSLKLTFCFTFFFFFFALPYFSAKYRASAVNKLTPYFQCLVVFFFCCWQIIDSIIFGMNWYTDSNGITLKGW